MSIVRGLKRLWVVGTIIWAIFIPLYVAWEVDHGVQSTYKLAYFSAEQTCSLMRDAPTNCFSVEYDKNVAKYGDNFGERFHRLFLNQGFWVASGWLLLFFVLIVVPPIIVIGLGAIFLWIGRGFVSR